MGIRQLTNTDAPAASRRVSGVAAGAAPADGIALRLAVADGLNYALRSTMSEGTPASRPTASLLALRRPMA